MFHLRLILTMNILILNRSGAKPQGSHSGSFQCNVVESSSGKSKPCIFPFKINAESFDCCTTYEDPDNKYWCSTSVNADGFHIGNGAGFWGYCPDECVTPNTTTMTVATAAIKVTASTKATTERITTTPPTFKPGHLEASEGLKKALADIAGVSPEEIVAKSKLQPRSELISGDNCHCTIQSECYWLNQLNKFNAEISMNSEWAKKVNSLLSYASCAKFKVQCCAFEPPPTDVKISAAVSAAETDENLGTWKPMASLGECGKQATNELIVGGKFAKPGEFPYMVLLAYFNDDNKLTFNCGGSLINRKYALTAAHCHTDALQIQKVILGETDVEKNPDCDTCPEVQVIDVEEVIVNRNFKLSRTLMGNDIALVRLKTPAVLFYDDPKSSYVTPVCLPWGLNDPGRNLKPSENFHVTGWGRISNNLPEENKKFELFGRSSAKLLKLEIPQITNEECVKYGSYENVNEQLQICAGAQEGKDICNGDSGGPLAYRRGAAEAWYQVGIVSGGNMACGSSTPGIFTRVTAYLDWIEANLKP